MADLPPPYFHLAFLFPRHFYLWHLHVGCNNASRYDSSFYVKNICSLENLLPMKINWSMPKHIKCGRLDGGKYSYRVVYDTGGGGGGHLGVVTFFQTWEAGAFFSNLNCNYCSIIVNHFLAIQTWGLYYYVNKLNFGICYSFFQTSSFKL